MKLGIYLFALAAGKKSKPGSKLQKLKKNGSKWQKTDDQWQLVKQKGSKAEKGGKTKSWGDNEVNSDACIYTENDGITSITTDAGLTEVTKCYRSFNCSNGSKVQARINEMSFGLYIKQFCNDNFIKFQYRIPREDFMDFYSWEDHHCDKDSDDINLGEWMTMEDSVNFSFEFNEWDFYDWYYYYTEYFADYYSDDGPYPMDPHPFPDWPVEQFPKFNIDIKCSEVPTTEPETTTPTVTDPTINPNYNTIDQMTDNFEEMLKKSELSQKAKDRTTSKFQKITSKLNDRHEKLLKKGCKFNQMTQLNFGAVFINYDNTCETIDTVFGDLINWGEDYVADCQDARGSVVANNNAWFSRHTTRVNKFKDNMMKFAKC